MRSSPIASVSSASITSRGDGAMIQVALAPCSPFSVTRSLMCACGELAARHDCRLHTHLAETHDEDEFCKARFGMSPLDYLDSVGWLNGRTWLAHGIHFSDADIARLGRHEVGVCHCPTSNMVLASGPMPHAGPRGGGLAGWTGRRWISLQ